MCGNDKPFKRIELFIRKKFIESGGHDKIPELISQPANIFNESNINRILLLRQDRIGDVLVSTPFFRELRKLLPNADIDILLGKNNIGVKEAAENYTDKTYLYKKKIMSTLKLMGDLRENKYDLIIDLFDNPSSTSTFFISKINPIYSLGFDKENRGAYTHTVPLPDKLEYHIVERVANLLLPFGISPSDIDLSLEYPLRDEDKASAAGRLGEKGDNLRMGINLAGSSTEKFWGVENQIAFIKQLEKKYPEIDIVIFCTKDYLKEYEEIAKSLKVRKAPEAKSVREWGAMLNECDMIFTTDTSAVHLASAFKIPCLALFDWSEKTITGMPWYPYKVRNRVLNAEKGGIKSLSPLFVFKKFEELYDESFSGRQQK